MPHEKVVEMSELQNYFHLPIVEVSKKLNVCCTVLKKICRKNGIKRWPHRKFKSLDNLIVGIQGDENVAKDTKAELDKLKKKRDLLIKNPNASARVSHLARKVGSKVANANTMTNTTSALAENSSSGSDISVCENTQALFSAVETVVAEQKAKEAQQANANQWEVPKSVSMESIAEIASSGNVVDPRMALAALTNTETPAPYKLPNIGMATNSCSFQLPPLNMALAKAHGPFAATM